MARWTCTGLACGALRVGVIAGLLMGVCGLAGCDTTTNSAPPAPTPRPAAVTGTWQATAVSGGARTVEVWHLQQGTGGRVSGDGTSTVTVAGGKVGHFSIDVHSGTVRRGTLALELYVAQLFGSGLTVVYQVRCAVTPSVLHCRSTIPLYPNAHVAPQDFYRR